MIKTVNSANIDISGAYAMFKNEAPKNIEQQAVVYRDEEKKHLPVNKASRSETYLEPLTHADRVLKLVCETLSIDYDGIKARDRKRPLSEARMIYSFIIMRLSTIEITYQQAGAVIQKDHATVMHGVKKAIELNQTSVPFSKKLDACIAEFKRQFSGAEYFILDYNHIPQY